jgi:REP element-mobilizing transposase RayT
MTLPRRVLQGTTYLVTRRCLGRRFLLRPDAAFNNLFVYCLALAAEKHGIEVHAHCVMSNHYHLVMTDVRGVLPDFLMALNRALAMSIKRLRGWDEVVWQPNIATSAVELTGPAEILDKVAYTLLNPVSAGLVRAPHRWPGVLSTCAQLAQGACEATRPSVWFKDTAPKTLKLRWTAPPGFARSEDYLGALEALVRSRLRELRANHRREGRAYLGRTRVNKTRVTDQPKTKKPRFGRSPTFSALTRTQWLEALKRLRAFRTAYREAYAAWRQGELGVEFPLGTWWVVRCAGAQAVT